MPYDEEAAAGREHQFDDDNMGFDPDHTSAISSGRFRSGLR